MINCCSTLPQVSGHRPTNFGCCLPVLCRERAAAVNRAMNDINKHQSLSLESTLTLFNLEITLNRIQFICDYLIVRNTAT